MISRGNLRLVEGPTAGNSLAGDARAALDRDQLLSLFEQACRQDPPKYDDITLERAFGSRLRRG